MKTRFYFAFALLSVPFLLLGCDSELEESDEQAADVRAADEELESEDSDELDDSDDSDESDDSEKPNSARQADCEPGKYGVDCAPCPAGSSCRGGDAEAKECDLGEYCPEGTARAGACPAGSYCETPSSEPVECAAGEYCVEGSTEPASCEVRDYCPAGSGVRQLCPAGSYCETPSSEPVECAAGEYCLAGSTEPASCEVGDYCPAGTARPGTCPAGSYCETPSGDPVLCAAGEYCAAGSTEPASCEVGDYCPPGSARPGTCPAGSYCETPSGDPVLCAAGEYCAAGSTEPASCEVGDYCPAGSGEALACAEGTWDADSDSTTACEVKTTCVAGESIATEGDALTDRSCAACEEGSFSDEENSANCTDFRTCSNGIETEGSAVADVFCKPEDFSISTGSRHSCALLDTGAVNCWGLNDYGQLGDDSKNDRDTPVAVDGIDGSTNKAVSISLGALHSCALLDTGAVNCWGLNDYGQLGDDSTTDSDTPVAVSGIDGSTNKAVSVSLGYFHSCALLDTGAVNCWGDNGNGQLGDDSTTDSDTPVAVAGIDGSTKKAVSISLGFYYSCALLDTGAVNCWGANVAGQLGDDSTTETDTPVAVDGIDGSTNKAVSVSAGGNHSCALLDTGAVNCWGDNFYGQLGDDSTTDSDTPVAVAGIDGSTKKAVSISLGAFHSCALLDTGALNCWGDNRDGRLGDDSTTDSDTPVAVSGIDGSTKKAVSVSAGGNHSCALLDTGALNCWGDNDYGQLGDDSTTDSDTPVAVIWP